MDPSPSFLSDDDPPTGHTPVRRFVPVGNLYCKNFIFCSRSEKPETRGVRVPFGPTVRARQGNAERVPRVLFTPKANFQKCPSRVIFGSCHTRSFLRMFQNRPKITLRRGARTVVRYVTVRKRRARPRSQRRLLSKDQRPSKATTTTKCRGGFNMPGVIHWTGN